jgi:hypothetical protein
MSGRCPWQVVEDCSDTPSDNLARACSSLSRTAVTQALLGRRQTSAEVAAELKVPLTRRRWPAEAPVRLLCGWVEAFATGAATSITG